MSDTVIVALITGGTTALVGVAGLAFNFFSSGAERRQRLAEREQDYKEWYRRTLFEKRLVAVQEAYKWLMQLNAAINGASPSAPDSEANRHLRDISSQTRAWYDQNVLYVYDALPNVSSFIGLTNEAYAYGSGRGQNLRIWDTFGQVEAVIRQRAEELLKAQTARGIAHDH